jgi:hypothetical protein
MIFTGAAEVAGIITVLGHERAALIQSGSYYLGRAEAYQTTNIYAAKMADILMMSTCANPDLTALDSAAWLRAGARPSIEHRKV